MPGRSPTEHDPIDGQKVANLTNTKCGGSDDSQRVLLDKLTLRQ